VTASPALAQYLYIDVNGDGLSFDREVAIGNVDVAPDVLTPEVTAVDIWYVTNQNYDGTEATCAADPSKSLTIQSYTTILRSIGFGAITFQGWTDHLGFSLPNITAGDGTFATQSGEAWIGRATTSPGLPAGTHKIGTLALTVTGCPTLIFGVDGLIDGDADTSFGSSCDGARSDNTLRLGPQGHPDYDFSVSFGTICHIGVVPTTWGKIKQQYR
jgi:hypothetical protein